MNTVIKRLSGCAAAVATIAMLATPALADGMRRGSIKDAAPKEERRCKLSANVGLATEYVFRGFSQTAEGPAIQGGFDVTCGILYAGVWASNLDWDRAGIDIEMDFYAGIKPVTGKITWDLGVIYYSYPKGPDFIAGRNNDYFELKVGGSGEVWKDGTLGVTVFYSPDYQYESGNTWTVETSFSQVLPKIGMFTPTFSALLGWQKNDGDAVYSFAFGNGTFTAAGLPITIEDSYLYWNAGLTLGFHEKWSLDLRYWDTNVGSNAGGSAFCKGAAFQCDERFVATLKFTY